MKNVFLSLIAAGLLFGFVSPQELSQNSSSGDGFTIQQKQSTGA
ncbi:hypothetical protein [Halalkalibacterium halodurans]|jgi:hypothetical protein|uniref:BH4012 protein n=1 Tax=Halalkalibacterium halodurans (strain ATCC BAA-125 / DSM 18197 / FERM 7344 / JCM 9153 / C-125) TaxID=272558 RepID=Q9K5S6_HALH5|nr:hypothetical protein [Halalkalibacterium halodurans]MDY7224718.1 hypothetical protein [Halalkalibacterium halodurans]MDY7243939.1 hypothetical protein [Halalkalibacterium halodurans]MED4125283.1 hypothetical protein [Halalkalibacterium halodurans]MED4173983.1 hypothetical protein [Halalkalibacterium halodurans]BAB07731.1 BH4012 [Halalkalibacterium halodurans C-125]